MKIIKFCKSYLWSHKIRLFLFVSLSFLGSLVSTVSPYLLGDFIDHLVSGANEREVFRFCIIFCGIVLFKIVRDYITSMSYTKMQVEMGYRLNMDVIKHLQGLSISYFSHKDNEYLNQRINGDCQALIAFCLGALRDIITNSMLFLIPVFILFSINRLILILLVGFTLLYVIVYGLMKNFIYQSNLKYRESLAKFFAGFFEQIHYIFQIKINSVQPEFNKRTESAFFNYRETMIKSQRVHYVYSSLDDIIGALAQMVLFVAGGLLVIRGKFTVGMFTVFSSYFRMILSSCRYFFGLAAAYQVATVSFHRTKDILNCREEPNGKIQLSEIKTIEVENVSFSYDVHGQLQKDVSKMEEGIDYPILEEKYRRRNVIDSFSYQFCRGNMYAITGKNGTGKTTLTKLILGLYGEERSGNIYYNHIPIEEIDVIHARKQRIGYAEQDPLLVEGSIYYNLTYQEFPEGTNDDENHSMSEEIRRLQSLVEILNMEEFLNRNPLFGGKPEKRMNFSGGEKQKIAILKVLYKNPDVCIFDEPTSALDQETKEKFLDYLGQWKKDKIIFVVTHDSELISCCDQTIEMKET